MKEKTFKYLKNAPLVISEEDVFLVDKLDYIKNLQIRKDVEERLERVQMNVLYTKSEKIRSLDISPYLKKEKTYPASSVFVVEQVNLEK